MLHYNSYAGDQKIEYYFGRVSGLLGHQGGETVQLACASGRGRLTATTAGWRAARKLSNTMGRKGKERGFYYADGF